MAKSVFDYKSPILYLHDRLGGDKRTGLKQKAAIALKCHTTLISQILSEKTQLSLEHAEKFNTFFQHTSEESRFFLLLAQHARAGTATLKAFFEKDIQELKQKHLTLHERIQGEEKISEQNAVKFYSSWIYGALHVLSSVPELHTKEALAERLGLKVNVISEAIEFLSVLGLVNIQEGRIKMGHAHVHLPKDSQHISKHHTNWRLKTIQSFDQGQSKAHSQDLHYSAVLTLSRSDATRIQKVILDELEKIVKIVSDSPSEDAFVYCFDYFRL